jgi:nucleoside-diphosphate-sugar epimerase
MRVAITGASGFIGGALVARHAAMGDSVSVLTRRNRGGWPAGVAVHMGDLADSSPGTRETLARFAAGADVVYHCAGDYREPARMEALHCGGTQRLTEAARGNIGHWVQLSSVGAYGPRHNDIITEETPPDPRGPYETTKTRADRLVLEAAAAGAFSATLLRPSIVFGPAMPNQSLFQLIGALDKGRFFFIGPKGASANYVSVECVVEALLLCAMRAEARGRVYNLSDWCSMEAFIEALCFALGRPVPQLRLPRAPTRFAASLLQAVPGFPLTASRVDALTNRSRYPITRIQAELGYRHPLTLEAALHDMVRAWQAHHADWGNLNRR